MCGKNPIALECRNTLRKLGENIFQNIIRSLYTANKRKMENGNDETPTKWPKKPGRNQCE